MLWLSVRDPRDSSCTHQPEVAQSAQSVNWISAHAAPVTKHSPWIQVFLVMVGPLQTSDMPLPSLVACLPVFQNEKRKGSNGLGTPGESVPYPLWDYVRYSAVH